MFRQHILLKIIQRLNPLHLRNLFLSGGQTSKQVAELLHGNLFHEIEITYDNSGLQYKINNNKTYILSYAQLIERELGGSWVNKIKLNQEDILEIAILEPIQVTNVLPFKINEQAKYLKVTFKKEIINFLILLIESLRNRFKYQTKTYYTGSNIYFEMKIWNKLEYIKKEQLRIYWGWGVGWVMWRVMLGDVEGNVGGWVECGG